VPSMEKHALRQGVHGNMVAQHTCGDRRLRLSGERSSLC
jgi:hypothetical protein